jgi:hypothetical protein
LWNLCWIAAVVRNSSSFCLHWLIQTLYIQRDNAISHRKRINEQTMVQHNTQKTKDWATRTPL